MVVDGEYHNEVTVESALGVLSGLPLEKESTEGEAEA